jgi:hypothetical protein
LALLFRKSATLTLVGFVLFSAIATPQSGLNRKPCRCITRPVRTG